MTGNPPRRRASPKLESRVLAAVDWLMSCRYCVLARTVAAVLLAVAAGLVWGLAS
jgi:hypothetical protein